MKGVLMKKICVSLVMASLFFVSSAKAEEHDKLVYGADTLGHANMAATLNLGLRIPDLVVFAPRFDIGLVDFLQFGLSGYFFPRDNDTEGSTNITFHPKVRFFQTENKRHSFAFSLIPSYTQMIREGTDPYALTISPVLIYEFIFETKKPTSLYVNAGTTHVIAGTSGDPALDEYGFLTFTTETGTHLFNGSVGFQHNFAKYFSMSLELGISVRLNHRTNPGNFDDFLETNWMPTGVLGLHFPF